MKQHSEGKLEQHEQAGDLPVKQTRQSQAAAAQGEQWEKPGCPLQDIADGMWLFARDFSNQRGGIVASGQAVAEG